MERRNSVASKIRAYLAKLPLGTVFTPAELVSGELGTSEAVRQALHRLASSGTIRRLSNGYYDIPKVSPKIGRLSPTREAIVSAIARKTGARIEKPQLDAANALGLTEQVVARSAYRTDLTNRRHLTIGGQTIDLLPTGPRSLRRDDHVAEQIIDALKALGPRGVDESRIEMLRKAVATPQLRKELSARSKRAPQWVASLVRRITQR